MTAARSPKIETWKTEKLKPFKQNAKLHSPEQVALLAKIIQRHGWDQPIVVDKKGVIIKGHGRLLAAQLLEMKAVPVVVRDDLTPAQVAEARLADNRVAEAGWDAALLRESLIDAQTLAGFEIDMTGFDISTVGAWEPDFADIDQVTETDEQAPGTIRISCPPEAKDEILVAVRTAVEPWGEKVKIK